MNRYLATFHSHFGAMSYFKAIKNQGIKSKIGPVPRKISASCGVCVSYEHDSPIEVSGCELEFVYIETDGKWDRIDVSI